MDGSVRDYGSTVYICCLSFDAVFQRVLVATTTKARTAPYGVVTVQTGRQIVTRSTDNVLQSVLVVSAAASGATSLPCAISVSVFFYVT